MDSLSPSPSPSKLMTIINNSFFSLNTTKNININDIIDKYIDELNLTHITSIMHKANKNQISINFLKLCNRLNTLLDNNECFPNCQNISNLIYGIRNLKNENDEEVSYLLITIIKVCERCLDDKPTSQNFGNSLLGLSGLSSSDANVRNLISSLLPILSNCEEKLSSQNVSNALYSLINKDINDGIEVEQLIMLITKFIIRSDCSLSGQALTNSIYALQNMKSNCTVVRKLISAITRLIIRAKPEISKGQLISNCLYGLQNCRSLHYQVRELLAALLPHFRLVTSSVTNQHISNALYGLQGLSCYYEVVKLVVKEVTRLCSFCSEGFTSQGVGNAIYGLQSLQETTAEVRALLREMIIKINLCDEILKPQELANALFGLQSLSNEASTEVGDLIKAIERQSLKCSYMQWSSNHIQQVFGLQLCVCNSEEIVGLLAVIKQKILSCSTFQSFQELGNCLYGINRLVISNKDAAEIALYLCSKIGINEIRSGNKCNKDYRALIQGLIPLTSPSIDETLRNCAQRILNELLTYQNNFIQNENEELSSHEKNKQHKLENSLQDFKNIKISMNQFILGYSYDILIEIHDSIDEEIKSQRDYKFIDVEIDGPNHLTNRSKHYENIRDKYLQSHEIMVLRYDLMKESEFSFDDFILLLKSYIQ